MISDKKIVVMLSGASNIDGQGKMIRMVTEAIVLQSDMEFYPYVLAETSGLYQTGGEGLHMVPPAQHADALERCRNKDVIVVDFTLPIAVNRNAALYCMAGIPFVMGTTGGDRELLGETIRQSNVAAVIATNMAVPVVIFQEMIKFAAANFSGALKGSKFLIQESHQSGKPDPSGTAVALLPFFEKLGLPYASDNIKKNGMERDPLVQELVLGVPPGNLGGHGYHGYFIRSPSGSVDLRFEHNIRGRNDYVDGVLLAIRFLAKIKNRDRQQGCVFSMVDVLRGQDKGI